MTAVDRGIGVVGVTCLGGCVNVAVARARLAGRSRRLIAALATCLVASACLASGALGADSLYWSSYQQAGGLRIGSLDGSGAQNLVTAESSPEGIAIDAAAGKIYWADATTGKIRVANLDGSGAQDLFPNDTENQPSGVAINAATGKIYWANAVSGSGAIRVGNLDGSGTPANLFSNVSYPVGVVIDPAAGKIYWGSYDTFVIQVGNLDGTGTPQTLFGGQTPEYYPTGIVLDPAANTIYWADEFVGTIRAGNLDGSGTPRTLFTDQCPNSSCGIGGLALDPGTRRLYWSDSALGTIQVGNPDSPGTGASQTLFTGETAAWFVALLRSPAGTSPPLISGSGGLGSPLSCTQGGWAGDVLTMFFYRAPRSFAYQWLAGGAVLAGATGPTYTPTAPGSYTCQVTATNQAGSTTQSSAPLTVAAPAPAPTPTPPPVPAAPSVASSAPAVLGSTAAGFSGSVNPEGLATTAHFEYGLDARYSASAGVVYDQSTPAQSIGADFSSHVITASPTGLVPSAVYHVRLVAANSAGSVTGPDQTFTTKADPLPPAPVLGKTENVAPVSGVVFIKPPPGKSLPGVRFAPRRARQGPGIRAADRGTPDPGRLPNRLAVRRPAGDGRAAECRQGASRCVRRRHLRSQTGARGPQQGPRDALPARRGLPRRADVSQLRRALGSGRRCDRA